MKKTFYYLPFAIYFLLYGVLFLKIGPPLSDFKEPMFFALLFLLSALLMAAGKWYGCLPGLLAGGWLIYTGSSYHGQLIDEWPIGIVLCLYYLVCGIFCARSARK